MTDYEEACFENLIGLSVTCFGVASLRMRCFTLFLVQESTFQTSPHTQNQLSDLGGVLTCNICYKIIHCYCLCIAYPLSISDNYANPKTKVNVYKLSLLPNIRKVRFYACVRERFSMKIINSNLQTVSQPSYKHPL